MLLRTLTVVRSSVVGIFRFMRRSFLLVLLRRRLISLIHWHLSLKSSHPWSSHPHHLTSHGHSSHSHSLHVHVWHTHHRSTHSHAGHHTATHRSVVRLHTLVPLGHQGRCHSSVHGIHHTTTLIESVLTTKVTSTIIPASVKVTSFRRRLSFSAFGLGTFHFNLKLASYDRDLPFCL